MKIKKYKSAKSILTAWVKGFDSEAKLSDTDTISGVLMDGKEHTAKETIEILNKNGFWGFADQEKKIVHVWFGVGAIFEDAIELFAHELGHLAGKQYKQDRAEELKAMSYQKVALEAFKLANKYY